MKFLTECLEDLDKQFRKHGGQLFVFENKPEVVFKALNKHYNLKLLCFEQDCEPVWRVRDENVKRLCDKRGVKWMECVSHTLWDPFRVIEENGGTPPLTYQAFLVRLRSLISFNYYLFLPIIFIVCCVKYWESSSPCR